MVDLSRMMNTRESLKNINFFIFCNPEFMIYRIIDYNNSRFKQDKHDENKIKNICVYSNISF